MLRSQESWSTQYYEDVSLMGNSRQTIKLYALNFFIAKTSSREFAYLQLILHPVTAICDIVTTSSVVLSEIKRWYYVLGLAMFFFLSQWKRLSGFRAYWGPTTNA